MDKIKFEKVSLEQFTKDMEKFFPDYTKEYIEYLYYSIKLPVRGSKGSAGYDVCSTVSFRLKTTDEPITIPLGIRAIMPGNMYLQIVPRSGIGFKTGVRLANTLAVIDSDYQNSPNEGHIMLKLVPGFKELSAQVGDRIAQGIFLKYYTTDDDNTEAVRTGGLGSTGV